MPFSQEDLTALAGLVIAAAGGGFGVAKLQKTPPPASPSGGDGGEALQAIRRIEEKVDQLDGKVSSVKYTVNVLAGDVDATKQDIARLKKLEPHIEEIHGRLVVLESRMLPKQ